MGGVYGIVECYIGNTQSVSIPILVSVLFSPVILISNQNIRKMFYVPNLQHEMVPIIWLGVCVCVCVCVRVRVCVCVSTAWKEEGEEQKEEGKGTGGEGMRACVSTA